MSSRLKVRTIEVYRIIWTGSSRF